MPFGSTKKEAPLGSMYLFTFGGAGNGDYRGELLRGLAVIVAYQTRLRLLPSQALVRLDGLYGNGAIIVDLIAAGVCFVMRGKDYARHGSASGQEAPRLARR